MQKKSTLKNEKKIIRYISIILFVVFYVTSSFGNIFSNNLSLIILLIIGTMTLMLRGKFLRVKRTYLFIICLLSANIILTTVVTGDEMKQMVLWGIYIFVSLALINSFSINKILISYVKLVYFLCIASLVMWITFIISPSLIQKLPIVSNSAGISAYTCFISSIYRAGNVGIARNQGMFWEPGAFQVIINLSLIVVLFLNINEIKLKKYIVVFVITIFTTFSTGGYIIMLLIFITYNIQYMIINK